MHSNTKCQLVPAHQHRTNTAEWAICTWNVGLCLADPHFPVTCMINSLHKPMPPSTCSKALKSISNSMFSWKFLDPTILTYHHGTTGDDGNGSWKTIAMSIMATAWGARLVHWTQSGTPLTLQNFHHINTSRQNLWHNLILFQTGNMPATDCTNEALFAAQQLTQALLCPTLAGPFNALP